MPHAVHRGRKKRPRVTATAKLGQKNKALYKTWTDKKFRAQRVLASGPNVGFADTRTCSIRLHCITP